MIEKASDGERWNSMEKNRVPEVLCNLRSLLNWITQKNRVPELLCNLEKASDGEPLE